jgi:hypothetical protein
MRFLLATGAVRGAAALGLAQAGSAPTTAPPRTARMTSRRVNRTVRSRGLVISSTYHLALRARPRDRAIVVGFRLRPRRARALSHATSCGGTATGL